MAKNKDKKTNPILLILFAGIIPLIVVIAIVFVVLSFTDVSAGKWVKEKGRNIPVLSKVILSEEDEELEEQLEKEQRKSNKQAEEIVELKETVNNLESIIEQLEEETIKLENKYESEEQLSNDNDEEASAPDPIKKMAASFKKMKSKQAAEIFQDLDEEVALQLMDELSNDVRGKILEEMDPKVAAKLTENLVK
ncbi:MAG TPA: hypothetical protein VK125_08665 [Bacillota bacterium]|nr:hypothetical protein [Bacillota bacterium]